MNSFFLFKESLLFGWQAIRSNLLRTILSSFGVIIGVFCMVGIFTLVDGLERSLNNSLTDVFGGMDNKLRIDKWPFSAESDYPWWKYVQRPYPSYGEYTYLKDNLEQASLVSVFSMTSRRKVRTRYNSTTSRSIMGVSDTYVDTHNLIFNQGRYFSQKESSSGIPVAILGATIAQDLVLYPSPINQEITLRGQKFRIIGVLKPYGTGLFGLPTPDENVYIPHTAFKRLYYSGRQRTFTSITIEGLSEDKNLVGLESELNSLMRTKRGIAPSEEASFSINRFDVIAGFVKENAATLNLIGIIIASFSILIGAFNIANILFVSVKERTFQIGLQKSLGATNTFILTQFIAEAMLLTLLGGAIGIGLVSAMVFVISLAPVGLPLILSWDNLSLGLIVCLSTGLLAGVAPAYQAAKLDPVVALRS